MKKEECECGYKHEPNSLGSYTLKPGRHLINGMLVVHDPAIKIAEPKVGDLRLTRRWHIERADYDYTLSRFFKNDAGFINPENNKAPAQWHVVKTTQDKAWADRTADHFDLEIEDEEDD